jgi:uncharacterized membrane protein (UPF0136 family)
MVKYGKWVILLYALLMLGGGIGGYAKAHSMPSLISGIVSAVLLGVAFVMIGSNARNGFGLSLFVSGALTLVFFERAMKTSAEPSAMGRNIGLALLSIVVAAIFGKCMAESS